MLSTLLFEKRLENVVYGLVGSNEPSGVVAISFWESIWLHLSSARRDRDCGCGNWLSGWVTTYTIFYVQAVLVTKRVTVVDLGFLKGDI